MARSRSSALSSSRSDKRRSGRVNSSCPTYQSDGSSSSSTLQNNTSSTSKPQPRQAHAWRGFFMPNRFCPIPVLKPVLLRPVPMPMDKAEGRSRRTRSKDKAKCLLCPSWYTVIIIFSRCFNNPLHPATRLLTMSGLCTVMWCHVRPVPMEKGEGQKGMVEAQTGKIKVVK